MSILGDNERWLPLSRLACNGCPYYHNKKCSGEIEATTASFSTREFDTSVIGCINPQRQVEYFSNLQSIRPPKQTANHKSLQLPNLIFGMDDGLKDFPLYAQN